MFTVYKTTNLITGKIYIGVHKTQNPNDKYLGSGKWINTAVKKHGRENFKKEVLFLFEEAGEAYAKEAELVNEAFLLESDTYNLRVGGTYSQSDKYGKRGKDNAQFGTSHIHKEGKTLRVREADIPLYLKNGWEMGRGEIFRSRMSELNSSRVQNVPRGEQHPFYRKKWVHREGVRLRVSESEVTVFMKDGWQVGLSPSCKNTPRGCDNGQAKLTWPLVREMRMLGSLGMRQWELSKKFNVSQMNVSLILRRKTWLE